MFIRQGIVCVVLAVTLLGIRFSFSDAKPPDLPIDPRVECPDGQEPSGRPGASQMPASTSIDKIITAVLGSECEELTRPIRVFLPAKGLVLTCAKFEVQEDKRVRLTQFTVIVLGKQREDGTYPAVKTIQSESAVLILDQPITSVSQLPNRQIISVDLINCKGVNVQPGDPAIRRANFEEGPPPQPASQNVDPEFQKMLRSTQPLDLAPVNPLPSDVPHELWTSPHPQIRRMNFLLPSFPSNDDRRNCPRTSLPEPGNVLYINPPPRILTIQEN